MKGQGSRLFCNETNDHFNIFNLHLHHWCNCIKHPPPPSPLVLITAETDSLPVLFQGALASSCIFRLTDWVKQKDLIKIWMLHNLGKLSFRAADLCRVTRFSTLRTGRRRCDMMNAHAAAETASAHKIYPENIIHAAFSFLISFLFLLFDSWTISFFSSARKQKQRQCADCVICKRPIYFPFSSQTSVRVHHRIKCVH